MTPSPTPRVEVRGLGRVLRSGSADLVVLDGLDLEVAAGEAVAILGRSGSGKSTLLALLAGLDRPTRGEIRIDGIDLATLGEAQLTRLRRDRIGFVFQSFRLLAQLTALENVLLPLELAGRPEALARAEELLAAVALSDRGHHYPAQLSGGEQQRVALARAFAIEPSLLLADEPTGNLDADTGATVLERLFALRSDSGTSLVLVTHDPAVAERADRCLLLEDGRLSAQTRST